MTITARCILKLLPDRRYAYGEKENTNAAVKRKLIAKGNNNVKMDRNADLRAMQAKR